MKMHCSFFHGVVVFSYFFRKSVVGTEYIPLIPAGGSRFHYVSPTDPHIHFEGKYVGMRPLYPSKRGQGGGKFVARSRMVA